jgi:hypothetical protein
MTTCPAWRTLGATARAILLDMIWRFWTASDADTVNLPGGFPFTFAATSVPCSSRTFSNSIAEIVDRGWFSRSLSRGNIPHFKPGNWRDFSPDAALPPLHTDVVHVKTKRKKGQKRSMGHFRESTELYTPLTREILTSEAWRALTALSRCVLVDMLHHFNALTYSDTKTLPDGFTYTWADCRVDITKRAFYSARSAITECCWFQTPPELQREGVIRFIPGNWRGYRAPEHATFRNTEAVRVKYGSKQRARRTAFLSQNGGEKIAVRGGEKIAVRETHTVAGKGEKIAVIGAP